MSEPTEADRETALKVVPKHRGMCDWDWHTGPTGPGCTCGADPERADIAAALAAEREKARAPFLALATYWEEGQRKHSEYWVRADAAANAIRHAAKEGK